MRGFLEVRVWSLQVVLALPPCYKPSQLLNKHAYEEMKTWDKDMTIHNVKYKVNFMP